MAIRTATIAAIGTLAICGTTLAAPASGSNATTSGEQRAATTVVKPGTLERGKRPRALHMRKRRIYDGKRSFKVRGPKHLNLVGKGDGGYITVRYGRYHGHLWQIRPHRKARRLGLVEQAAYNGGDQYLVSDAGNRLVITEPERTGFMMWVRALPSGKQIRFRWMGNWARPRAFPKNRVLFSKSESTFWYAPKKNERTEVVHSESALASPADNRLVLRGDRGEPRYRLVEFDDPTNVIASWQHGRPLEVSPDGSYVVVTNGKRTLQIRSLDDGSLVRTFSVAGHIKSATARWESKRRVLFTAKGGKLAANVRCTVGGKCERTTRLVKHPRKLGIDWP